MPTWSLTAGRLHRTSASRSGRERRLGDRRGDRRADTNAPVDPRRASRGASHIRGRRGGVATTRHPAARDESSRRFLDVRMAPLDVRPGLAPSDARDAERDRSNPHHIRRAGWRTCSVGVRRVSSPRFARSRAPRRGLRARPPPPGSSLAGGFRSLFRGAGENGQTCTRKPARDARATRARAPAMRDPANPRFRRPRRLRSREENLSLAPSSRAQPCAPARTKLTLVETISRIFLPNAKTDARAARAQIPRLIRHTRKTYASQIFILDELNLRVGFSPADSSPFAARCHPDRDA